MRNPLDNLILKFDTDKVAVFDRDYQQLFPDARPLKAVVKEQAKLMEHPVESGSIITDHRIILPVEINISLLIQSYDYADIYRQIRQHYLNSTFLIVQTKSGTYENQVIQSMPHEEDPEQYDTLSIALSLKQVQVVRAQYGISPRAAKDTNTVNRGAINGVPPSVSAQTQASAAVGAR